MSGKIEISRELAERLLNFTCNEEYDELRKILAAPVVERQAVAYLVEAYDDIAVRRTILSKVPFDDSNREMREWARPWLVRETSLYTSPVALNTRMAAILQSLRTNANPALFAPGQLAEVDACLDKVKELNQ